MPRAFLVVMDSVGIGGAPDADRYFNGTVPDTGANTVAHIAEACASGSASRNRQGPLSVPHLDVMGLGRAVQLASGEVVPGLGCEPTGLWGAATETSRGKDTPSGHWELAGLPVPWAWHHFERVENSFPQDIIDRVCELAGSDGILGNCHASGTDIVTRLGAEHVRTGWPICYTSADSVFQIAAHEETFGLQRLLDLCEALAPMLHRMRVGRVIARPFIGTGKTGFHRTGHRKDFAIAPPGPVLTNRVQDAGRRVYALGKIGDIFSMQGIDEVRKGTDAELMVHLHDLVETAEEGGLTFANFVEFDSLYGHRRDVAGYAAALEWFDAGIGAVSARLRDGDMLLVTADHGNDPTWHGTDHTRERVPVLVTGPQIPGGCLGHIGFQDVATLIADHLGVRMP
jgi:phosphopentomutase